MGGDGATRKIQLALYNVDVYVTCEVFGAILKVAFTKFNSSVNKNQFLRMQQIIISFESMWASRSTSLVDPMIEKKLEKFKRAIIEIIGCEAIAVVLVRNT